MYIGLSINYMSWMKIISFVFLFSETTELKSKTYLSGVLSSPKILFVIFVLFALVACLFELFCDCFVFPPEDNCN